MNYSEVIKSLSNATAFDLYRMRAAIDRVLDEPRWMQSVQVRLKVGQDVQYFDPQANALRQGKVLEMRRKQAVVLDMNDARRWLISYAAINLDGSDVQIREQKVQGLGRNEVAIGDVVGFIDRVFVCRIRFRHTTSNTVIPSPKIPGTGARAARFHTRLLAETVWPESHSSRPWCIAPGLRQTRWPSSQ